MDYLFSCSTQFTLVFSCTFLSVSLYICVYNPQILNIKIDLLGFKTDELADFKETHTQSSVETAEDPELKQLVIVKKNYLLRTASGTILKYVSYTLSADNVWCEKYDLLNYRQYTTSVTSTRWG